MSTPRSRSNSTFTSQIDKMTTEEIAELKGEPAFIYNVDTDEYLAWNGVEWSNITSDGSFVDTGLEAVNENGKKLYLNPNDAVGYRFAGADPANYGDIGQQAIDLSLGFENSEVTPTNQMPTGVDMSTEVYYGACGAGSIVTGRKNVNRANVSAMFGDTNIMNGGPNSEPVYFIGGLTQGSQNESYGLNYYNIQSGLRNLMGDKNATAFSFNGFSSGTPILYHGAQIGMKNEMQGGYASVQMGYGLLGSGPFCTTVGCANVDETLTPAIANTSGRNNLNPRFIVGVGDWAGPGSLPTIGTRRNGFVVMSNGTAKFPELTNAKIDASNDDSAVTKGYVKNLKVADSVEVADATTEGKIRYTKTANSSAVEMVMQTGASTYAWVTIKENTW